MASILESVLNGGRVSRNGDFVVVTLQNLSFVIPAIEFQQVQQWARSRVSNGIPHRDRADFVNRFETLLARQGCGIATKGSNKALATIVQKMEQAGLSLDEWMIPRGIFDSVEIQRKKPEDAPAGEEAADQAPGDSPDDPAA
ncbi:MAG TPA: hypothetical protein VN046_09305 [Stenotrophobium sp.]|nr:hypothetical protein [Stenotrophobium sp.]